MVESIEQLNMFPYAHQLQKKYVNVRAELARRTIFVMYYTVVGSGFFAEAIYDGYAYKLEFVGYNLHITIHVTTNCFYGKANKGLNMQVSGKCWGL